MWWNRLVFIFGFGRVNMPAGNLWNKGGKDFALKPGTKVPPIYPKCFEISFKKFSGLLIFKFLPTKKGGFFNLTYPKKQKEKRFLKNFLPEGPAPQPGNLGDSFLGGLFYAQNKFLGVGVLTPQYCKAPKEILFSRDRALFFH
ncbi:hypothetical protein ACFFWB_26930 [Flavobacterium procerum]|uniref:hypothetical protein n=1 Tax=Flavobacterium procerum TaxID=1455569 RepID=UPI0035ECD66C